MANDINDILGINLPKEEPASKSKIISDLLQNLVFSLGQGYSAQGGARGSQARSAGIGAALQGPMVLQQIRDKQRQDQQEQAITLAKTRELLRQGRNEDAMALVKAKWGTPTAMTQAAPEPFVEGNPDTGFNLQSRGEAQYAPIDPAQYELSSGQKVPIPIMNQDQMMKQQGATLRQQKGIEAEFAPKNDLITIPGVGLYSIKEGRVIPGTAAPQRPLSTPRGALDLGTKQIIQGTEPIAPPGPTPPTIRTKAGVMQWNPETRRYDIKAGDLPPTNSLMRDSVGYADLDAVKKAQVDAVAAKVAAGEYTVANGQAALGGVRGGLGGALTEALTNTLVLPTAVRTANSDIERAKNLLVPVHQLVAEINQTSDISEKIKKSAQLDNYVRAIGTQFARAKGERGVVTDRDVDRVLGLIPGWKSANFAPGYAEENLKLVEDAFARDQQALLSKYFTKFQQGGETTGQAKKSPLDDEIMKAIRGAKKPGG